MFEIEVCGKKFHVELSDWNGHSDKIDRCIGTIASRLHMLDKYLIVDAHDAMIADQASSDMQFEIFNRQDRDADGGYWQVKDIPQAAMSDVLGFAGGDGYVAEITAV
jgi:hypothetical protein